MNIIFSDAADSVANNYTKLELDTIQVADKTITAYCLVEHIPLAEFPMVEHNKKNHATLIEQYQQRNWNYCIQAIETLLGKWDGEVDTFYNELQTRIEEFKQNPPPDNWNGVIQG